MMTNRIRRALLALALALGAGCGLFWDDPYVTVTTSGVSSVQLGSTSASCTVSVKDSVRPVRSI